MCQSIAQGGRRCPIHRHESIVVLAQARAVSGLDANQTSDVFNTLRREGRHADEPTDAQWSQYLDSLEASTQGQEGAAEKIAAARESGKPGGDTFYALNRVVLKSEGLAGNLNVAVNRLSRRIGLSNTDARERYAALYAEVERGRNAETPPEFTRAAVRAHINAGLPADISTVTALARLRNRVIPAAATPEPEPVVEAVVEAPTPPQAAQPEVGPRIQRQNIARAGSAFSYGGYDPEDGRLELQFRGREDVYIYRNVPERVWTEISQGSRAAAVYSREIRGRSEYRYASREEAEAAGEGVRCGMCGQFRASSHTCPERQREEIREVVTPRIRTELQAVNAPEEVIEEAISNTVESNISDEPVVNATVIAEVDEEEAEEAEEAESTPAAPVRRTRRPRNAPNSEETLNADAIALQVSPPELPSPPGLVEREFRLPSTVTYWSSPIREVTLSNLGYYTSDEIAAQYADQIERDRRFLVIPEMDEAGNQVTFTDSYGRTRESYIVHHSWLTSEERVTFEKINGSYRHYKVSIRPQGNPGLKYDSRDEMIAAETAAHAAAGHADLEREHVDANATMTRRYVGEHGRDDRISWVSVRDARRVLGEGKVISSDVRWQGERPNHYIDANGNEVGAGSFMVYGTLAVRRNADGTMETVSGRHELRCDCSQYSRNYHCAHVDQVRTSGANVAQQMFSPPARSTSGDGTPAVLSRPDVTVIDSGEEGALTSITFNGIAGNYARRRVGLTRVSDLENTTDPAQVRSNYIAAMSPVNAPPAGVINQALRHASTVTVPYERESRTLYVGGYHLRGSNVTGTVSLTRAEDGTVSVSSHTLRCSCADYRRDYDCEHVRSSVATAPRLTSTEFASRDTVNAVTAQATSLQSAIVAEQQARGLVDRGRAPSIERAREMIIEDREAQERARIERQAREDRELAERMTRQLEENRLRQEQWERENPGIAQAWTEYRADQKTRWSQPEGPSYSESPEAFHADVEAALQRKSRGEAPIPYETENVTDGICAPVPGARKFGVELEFDIKSGVNKSAAISAIGRDLHAAGLTSTSSQLGYHSARASGWQKWSLEADCTVSGELVSPLMSDTPEDWAQLKQVCEILERHGAVASTRAGSHVHISTGSYQRSTAKHAELLRMNNEHQDTLFRLASNPKRGTHRGTQWCAPNAVDRGPTEIPANVLQSHSILGGHNSHGVSMNMESTGLSQMEKSHVEFRMWDSTLDASVIQQQVKVSAAMTEAAERRVEEQGASIRNNNISNPIGSHRLKENAALSGQSRHTVESLAASSEGARKFADTIFRREGDKRGFASLFAITRWQNS